MAVRAPEAIRESWGEEAVGAFIPWMDEWLKERAVPRDEYREVLSRLDVLEHDVTNIKTDVRELRREMHERFDRMNERFDEMYRHISTMTRWTVGTLALFGTIITILIAIAQFI